METKTYSLYSRQTRYPSRFSDSFELLRDEIPEFCLAYNRLFVLLLEFQKNKMDRINYTPPSDEEVVNVTIKDTIHNPSKPIGTITRCHGITPKIGWEQELNPKCTEIDKTNIRNMISTFEYTLELPNRNVTLKLIDSECRHISSIMLVEENTIFQDDIGSTLTKMSLYSPYYGIFIIEHDKNVYNISKAELHDDDKYYIQTKCVYESDLNYIYFVDKQDISNIYKLDKEFDLTAKFLKFLGQDVRRFVECLNYNCFIYSKDKIDEEAIIFAKENTNEIEYKILDSNILHLYHEHESVDLCLDKLRFKQGFHIVSATNDKNINYIVTKSLASEYIGRYGIFNF